MKQLEWKVTVGTPTNFTLRAIPIPPKVVPCAPGIDVRLTSFNLGSIRTSFVPMVLFANSTTDLMAQGERFLNERPCTRLCKCIVYSRVTTSCNAERVLGVCRRSRKMSKDVDKLQQMTHFLSRFAVLGSLCSGEYRCGLQNGHDIPWVQRRSVRWRVKMLLTSELYSGSLWVPSRSVGAPLALCSSRVGTSTVGISDVLCFIGPIVL